MAQLAGAGAASEAGVVSWAGAGAAGFGAAAFFGALLFGAAFFAVVLAAFFAVFLAAFFAVFLAAFFGAAFLAFLADFFTAFFFDVFLADFFAIKSFFLAFLPFLFFFPLAIVVLLLPPISVHQAFQVSPSASLAVSSPAALHARSRPINPALAVNRPSPNREAQSCARREPMCRRQSASCIRCCPRQSCPA